MSDESVVVQVSAPPEPGPAPVADVAPVADAAVEIARIEADRDITIAAIGAETAAVAIEAAADENDEDVEWLRSELGGLRLSCETLAAELADLQVERARTAEALASLDRMLTAALATAEPIPSPPSKPDPGPADPAASERADGPPESPEAPPPARKRRWM